LRISFVGEIILWSSLSSSLQRFWLVICDVASSSVKPRTQSIQNFF
jgi:hypothetical protein